MSHKVLVGGTGYEVSGGRGFMGSTGYDIAGGKTLVDGTGYDIGFNNFDGIIYEAGDSNVRVGEVIGVELPQGSYLVKSRAPGYSISDDGFRFFAGYGQTPNPVAGGAVTVPINYILFIGPIDFAGWTTLNFTTGKSTTNQNYGDFTNTTEDTSVTGLAVQFLRDGGDYSIDIEAFSGEYYVKLLTTDYLYNGGLCTKIWLE